MTETQRAALRLAEEVGQIVKLRNSTIAIDSLEMSMEMSMEEKTQLAEATAAVAGIRIWLQRYPDGGCDALYVSPEGPVRAWEPWCDHEQAGKLVEKLRPSMEYTKDGAWVATVRGNSGREYCGRGKTYTEAVARAVKEYHDLSGWFD